MNARDKQTVRRLIRRESDAAALRLRFRRKVQHCQLPRNYYAIQEALAIIDERRRLRVNLESGGRGLLG